MLKAAVAEMTEVGGSEVAARASAQINSRLADYLELTKPRIAVMALFTVAIGYLLAAAPHVDVLVLFNTLLGAGLVAAGGSALNQVLERHSDAQMYRTANRPLPAGRLSTAEAAAFGVVLSLLGLVYLICLVPYLAAVAAGITLITYVGIYTPLKRITVWNTLVGAVPGALPPVIGWCAAGHREGVIVGVGLFLILFFWQLPHFMAIAWIYREDYARGGHKMVPIGDRSGQRTATVMWLTCLALIPASLLPLLAGGVGAAYAVGAIALGAFFLGRAEQFRRHRTDRQARRVLRGSLLYLPGVLGFLLLDHLVNLI